jgi:hypothetical protein
MSFRDRDAVVGIATRLWAGRSGFDFRQEKEMSLFSITSRPVLGAHPASYLMDIGVLSRG